METTTATTTTIRTTATVTSGDGAEKKKKKRRPDGTDGKKLRRKRRPESEKENNGMRSSGAAGEERRIHVRSFDSAKAIKKFSKAAPEESSTDCRSCGRQVFQMERIKAEKAVWHKDCFRCCECNKHLTLDTYASHERQLYCKPHHKLLFQPKPVEIKDERTHRMRRNEVIIRESQPEQLPPDVIRSCSKSDYGLEELQNLNVKDRFSKFQHTSDGEQDNAPAAVEIKRSQAILKKMKKFTADQQDRAGVQLEGGSSGQESSDESDDEDDVERDPAVVRSARSWHKVRPDSFAGMGDAKHRFEEGHERRERLRTERKGEMTKLRGMICGARDRKLAYQESLQQEAELKRIVPDPSAEIQNLNLKAYETAVQEAESRRPAERQSEVTRQKATSMASRFDRGEICLTEEDAETLRRREDDAALFREAGTARGARSLFRDLDACEKEGVVMRSPSSTGKTEFRRSLYESQPGPEVVKSNSKQHHDDVHVETSAVSGRFKFFETYKEPEVRKERFRFSPPREGTVKGSSPDREIERDPNVVRADDRLDGGPVVRSSTATEMLNKFKQMERGDDIKGSKVPAGREKPQGNARSMLSMFRQMEEDAQREEVPEGLKPLKSFTPPPEYTEETDSDEYTYTDDSECTDSEEDSESGMVRSSHKLNDDFLTQRTDHARNLKAKFERWEQNMEQKKMFDADDENRPSLETARNLRSMFEAMKDQPVVVEKPRPKVNRFI